MVGGAFASPIVEAGAFSLSHPVTLIDYEGARTDGRAVGADLAQSPAQLKGAYSDSGRCAWIIARRGLDVAYVEARGKRWRVLDQEDRSTALQGAGDQRTYRLQLVEAEVQA